MFFSRYLIGTIVLSFIALAPGTALATAQITVKAGSAQEANKARVLINGKPVGGLPLTIKLQKGRYLFEVESPGMKVWRRWVDVKGDEAQTLEPSFAALKNPAKPTVGNLLVTCDDLTATVMVDGKPHGVVPVLVSGLSGSHQVVVKTEKGSKTVAVTVAAGETKKLRVALLEKEPGGTLRVMASPPGVVISINGKRLGKAPATQSGLSTGKHLVEGQLDGYRTATQSVFVQAGQEVTIRLVLEERPAKVSQGALRVVSKPQGALVFVDGKFIGKTPLLKKDLLVGAHVVTLRREGHGEQLRTIHVKPGEIASLNVALPRGLSASRPASQPASQPTSQPTSGDSFFTHDAHLVPSGYIAADASLGFPQLLEVRLLTGIFARDRLAMDGGVVLRTYGVMTEVSGRFRLRLVDAHPFFAAAFFEIGGGGGANSRNTFHFTLGGIGSWAALPWLRLSARFGVETYSDRNCPGTPQQGELDVCTSPPDGVSLTEVRDRAVGLRLLIGTIAEVPITSWMGLFASVEGAAAASRLAYSDAFSSVMAATDTHVYARIGVTFRR